MRIRHDGRRHLFLVEVVVHLSQVGVSVAVHRAAMDVEAKQLPGHDEHTNVAHGTEVHKLFYLVFKETFVDQKHVEPLWGRSAEICYQLSLKPM